MSKVNFQYNAAGLYAFAGFTQGVADKVGSTQYQDAVIQYAQAKLTDAFDRWMDAVARANPEDYNHVYEWPNTFQDWGETVGNPAHRLWRHVLTGVGARRSSTFAFIPSNRPTPVDPILTTPGPTGKSVKEGVHVFGLKASAFEYGINIEVSPKLSNFLAYVGDVENRQHMGIDHGAQGVNEVTGVAFSIGPVNFKAGGGHFQNNFTSAYFSWWSSMAEGEFNATIKPNLERHVVPRDALGRFIKRANKGASVFGKKAASFSMTAQAAENARTYNEARSGAKQALEGAQNNYINEARARRRMLYGS